MNLTISFPIRYKLTLIITLTCVSVLALTSLAFFGYYRVQYRDSLVANITTQANIIGTNTSAAILPGRSDRPRRRRRDNTVLC